MAQSFRFIHCGDLHLGAPFTAIPSLGKYCDDYILQSTYKAFAKIVDIAKEEAVDALLISGDIYNEADHNLEAQVRFVRELERLSEANIKVFIVHGNHDPVESWTARVKMPRGVHIFSADHVERVPLKIRGREVAAIYGMSHARKDISEDLVPNFITDANDHYSIGLLHASVGARPGHDIYAPTSMEKLLDVGMDYWALGHIHKREVLHKNPYIVYSGNTQGLKSKEKGAKGCYLVHVTSTGHTDLKFIDTGAVTFVDSEIDISELQTIQDLQEMIRHTKTIMQNKMKKPVLIKLHLVGRGPLSQVCHDDEVLKLLLEEAKKEERGKYAFAVCYKIIDDTDYEIELQERRLLPDVLGDYLAAYDEVAKLSELEKEQSLFNIIADRSEFKRLGKYSEVMDTELLERAFKRAEIEGAIKIIGENNED